MVRPRNSAPINGRPVRSPTIISRSWRYRVVFGGVKVVCWAAQMAARGPIKPTIIEA
jgi:hypothetical protein